MTVLCAVRDGWRTFIAADSRTCFGDQYFDHTRKWHLSPCGKMAFALSGQNRVPYLMEGWWRKKGKKDARAFATDLKKALLADGWKMTEVEGESQDARVSGFFVDKGLWMITCDFTAMKVPDKVPMADGSGERFALGAMWAHRLDHYDDWSDMLRVGVEAAIAHDCRCGGDVFVDVIKD